MADKGKGIADDSSSGKRKRGGDDKSSHRKRKNLNVLQFFEDSAFEIDESGSSDDDDFINDDFINDVFIEDGRDMDVQVEDVQDADVEVKTEPKTPNLPFFPKEEEMDEEELEKILEARYKPGANFVKYSEDRTEAARMDERNTMPFVMDPTIWKVKCTVGRERHSAFCLMQKFVDLQTLGTKLQIISAFAVEHVKGFIYIEAEKQCDINEACKGLSNIYPSRVTTVPVHEVSHLFSVRSKYSGVSVDTWARVKNGKYKGDLAQVVNVNEPQRKATVKLVPRIDLQAMADKFGGGVKGKKAAIPAPRLVTSSELEAYRPLIQYRRDRDNGDIYEVFDGMTLKDGYLFKKVPLDSLTFWDVRPSEAELIKFEPAKKEESKDVEWLTGLFGERKKKKPTINNDKVGGKGEGSSSSSMENSFEAHDFVFHGRKGFGVVIGREKDDRIKVLEEGSDRPMVVAVEARLLKKAAFDKKFTALDQHKKIISINDLVRILEGPLEDKQGIAKQIYRGVVFLHDENEPENCGYFCAKSQICEKMESSADLFKGKGGKADASGFDDFPSSPKSPLSPKKPWEGRENNRNSNQEDKDGFSVGQSLRIRVGPLKGYMCRVMAIRYSDITVKLDSQHKILTVKAEHLAEVRGKTSAVSTGDGQDSAKPFELLGDPDSSQGWNAGTVASDSGGWNTGGPSTERSSWAPFPAAGSSLPSSSANPFNSADNDDNKDDAWGAKTTQNQSSAWGAAAASEKKDGGWGASSSGVKAGSSDDAGWGKQKETSENKSAWNSAAPTAQSGGWGNSGGGSALPDSGAGGWGDTKKDGEDTKGWGKTDNSSGGGGWGNKVVADGGNNDGGTGGWGKTASVTGGESEGASGWGSKKEGGSSWGKAAADGGGSSWGKGAGGGGSTWGNEDGGSSWSKQDGGGRGGGGGGRGNAPRVGVGEVGMLVTSVARVGIWRGSAPRVVVGVVMLALSVVKPGICLGNALRVAVAAEVVTSAVRVGICLGSALRVVTEVVEEENLALSVVRVVICPGSALRVVAGAVVVGEVATSAVKVAICLGNAPKVVVAAEAVAEVVTSVVKVGICLGSAPRVVTVVVEAGNLASSAAKVVICLESALRAAAAAAEVVTSVVRVDICLGSVPRVAAAAVVVAGVAISVERVGICLESARRVAAAVAVVEVVTSAARVGICLGNVPRVAAEVVEAMVVVVEAMVVVAVGAKRMTRAEVVGEKRMTQAETVGEKRMTPVEVVGEKRMTQEEAVGAVQSKEVVMRQAAQGRGVALMEVKRRLKAAVGAVVVKQQQVKRRQGDGEALRTLLVQEEVAGTRITAGRRNVFFLSSDGWFRFLFCLVLMNV